MLLEKNKPCMIMDVINESLNLISDKLMNQIEKKVEK